MRIMNIKDCTVNTLNINAKHNKSSLIIVTNILWPSDLGGKTSKAINKVDIRLRIGQLDLLPQQLRLSYVGV